MNRLLHIFYLFIKPIFYFAKSKKSPGFKIPLPVKYLIPVLFILTCNFYASGQNYPMTNGTISDCSGNFKDPGNNGQYANSSNFTETILEQPV